MVWLLDRGYTEEFAWNYNDHRMFPEIDLPEPDRETVMREVRQHWTEYRKRKQAVQEEVA